jgi:hypothetical protein
VPSITDGTQSRGDYRPDISLAALLPLVVKTGALDFARSEITPWRAQHTLRTSHSHQLSTVSHLPAQMPILVFLQCLRLALYLQIIENQPQPLLASPSKPEGKAGWRIPDGISRPQSNPLWDWPVLLLCSGKLLLRAESFVALFVAGGVSNFPNHFF